MKRARARAMAAIHRDLAQEPEADERTPRGQVAARFGHVDRRRVAVAAADVRPSLADEKPRYVV